MRASVVLGNKRSMLPQSNVPANMVPVVLFPRLVRVFVCLIHPSTPRFARRSGQVANHFVGL